MTSGANSEVAQEKLLQKEETETKKKKESLKYSKVINN